MKKFVAIIIVVIIMLTLCSCVTTDTDINNYDNDIKKYQASSFMPDLDDIGDYKNISYFSKKVEAIFPDYSMQLIVKYDEETFLKEKERLETAYTYLDKPQKSDWYDTDYTMPVSEFSVAGFDFKIAVFEDTDYPKNFGMVGVSDKTQEIAYLWAYCPDLDLICTVNDDAEKEMLEFINYLFSLKLGNSNLTVDVSENGQKENDNADSNNEVNDMQLLDFLKENITNQNTTDEIIDVFKQMCKTPIEEDLLLLEYGVYDFDEEDLFYFDLVRQYPDGDGEYYQLRISLMFAPDKQNRKLNDTLWSDDTDEDFFDYIRKSSGYDYAKNHSFKSIDIRIDQT